MQLLLLCSFLRTSGIVVRSLKWDLNVRSPAIQRDRCDHMKGVSGPQNQHRAFKWNIQRHRGFSRRPCWRYKTIQTVCIKNRIYFPQKKHFIVLYFQQAWPFPSRSCTSFSKRVLWHSLSYENEGRKVMHLASFLTSFFHRGAVAHLVRAPVL